MLHRLWINCAFRAQVGTAAQRQVHGGVRRGLWRQLASLTLVLLLTGHVPFHGTALSQRPTHKEHLHRRCRANESTRGKCLAQSKHAHSKWINCLSSLYKVYATDQVQLCLRNHSDIPVKSWVVMTSLPRWPEDLRLCEEWPFWWTHWLTQQATPSQTVWPSAGVPTSAGTNTSTLRGHTCWLLLRQWQPYHTYSLSYSSCEELFHLWCGVLNFYITPWLGRNAF